MFLQIFKTNFVSDDDDDDDDGLIVWPDIAVSLGTD